MKKSLTGIAAALIALTFAPAAQAETASYWQEQICEFTDESGDPATLLRPEERQFLVNGVSREKLAGATAQTVHEFGLVIRKFDIGEDAVTMEAWRYARKKNKSATGRGIVLSLDIENGAEPSAMQHKIGFKARFQGINLHDPCIYNTIVARLANKLPAGAEISRKQ